MPALRQDREDAADGGQKAHVEHAVGFVEHEDFDIAQVNQLASDEILQAAGSCDHQAGAGAHGLNLCFFRDAADDQRSFGELLAAQFFVFFVDLDRQLARGQQNQYAHFLRRFALQHFE